MKPDELEDVDELEEPALEPPPRPPETDGLPVPVPAPELPDDPEEELELPFTLSPTDPFTAATVPLIGATSLVASTSFSAFVTASWALVTLA
jgi:hypothetical protein